MERTAGPFNPPREITELRAARPVSPMIFPDGHEGWLVTGYEAVRQMMADTRFSSRLDLDVVHVPYETPGMPVATEPSPQLPGMFIANTYDDQPAALPVAPIAAPAPGPGAPPPPAHNGPANWIKISASDDGSFTVSGMPAIKTAIRSRPWLSLPSQRPGPGGRAAATESGRYLLTSYVRFPTITNNARIARMLMPRISWRLRSR